ncbi:MAG: sulfite exporter TauE/SafE family protein [Firmicutes bacterium]|nr:sulfite exporter TauE/SafE family protein [Bacillota bacterium]
MQTKSWLTYGLIGLVAGTVNGLLGIGGGTILIPGMVYLLGVKQHQAHATSLLIVLPISLVSMLVYHRYGHIRIAPLLGLALATSVGAIIGAILMNYCRPDLLRKGFALYMLLAGLRMLF